jgi:hypothetical protein
VHLWARAFTSARLSTSQKSGAAQAICSGGEAVAITRMHRFQRPLLLLVVQLFSKLFHGIQHSELQTSRNSSSQLIFQSLDILDHDYSFNSRSCVAKRVHRIQVLMNFTCDVETRTRHVLIITFSTYVCHTNYKRQVHMHVTISRCQNTVNNAKKTNARTRKYCGNSMNAELSDCIDRSPRRHSF